MDITFTTTPKLEALPAPGVATARKVSRCFSSAPIPNIAGSALSAVTFDAVSVPAENLLGELHAGWAPLSTAATKAAVQQTATIVGAARAVLDMTNQYAKDREQFAHPIGRYQAVQYLVTDILIDLHRADLLAKLAAAHLHRQAHEVHVDYDLTPFSRRAKLWENNLRDARYHQELPANAMSI